MYREKCNCWNNTECPWDGKGLAECIVYKAKASTINQKNIYVGSAEGDIKRKCNNHALSFRSKQYKQRTEFSNHICSLKDRNTEFSLKWSIKTKAMSYKSGSQKM